MEQMIVAFEGPFSWPGVPGAPSVFDVDVRRKPGIYLWTVERSDGFLVYYVGETGRSFDVRMFEHYKEHAAGAYHLYSPVEFAKGEKVPLWPGRYDSRDRRTARECVEQYARLAPAIFELTHIYRFFLAPVACDERPRRRIEASIWATLKAAPGLAGSFQDDGIRYHPRRDDEPPITCSIECPASLIGLPSSVSG